MFFSLPRPGAFLAFFAVVEAILLTILAVALKLGGVLLLSWWWVCSPIPLTAVVIFVVAGALSIFER